MARMFVCRACGRYVELPLDRNFTIGFTHDHNSRHRYWMVEFDTKEEAFQMIERIVREGKTEEEL